MTELERYKETLGRYIKALGVAKEALAQLNGADNRAFTAHHAQDAASRIDAILNPPPVYEEVTVERWECQKCNSVYAVNGGHIPDKPISRGEGWGSCKCGYGGLLDNEAIKLTGTRRVQVAQKVERSVELWFDEGGGYQVRGLMEFSFRGKKGTFTWQE